MQNNRNVVTKVETTDGTFVVKDFRGMYLLNRLAYSIFRKSKAIRSFEHSERLNEMGFLTPDPVAWIDDYALGFLRRSIFISAYFPYKTLQQFIVENEGRSGDFKQLLLEQLAAFAFRLHQKGVYHQDFSVGNIFVIPMDSGYDFALTDLNRMRFLRSLSYEGAIGNFRKIQLDRTDLEVFITHYARLSSQSPEASLTLFYRLKDRSSRLRRARKKVRFYTLGFIESLQEAKRKTVPPPELSRNNNPIFRIANDHELQSPNQSASQNAVPQPHEKHSKFPDRREHERLSGKENSDYPTKSPTRESATNNAPDTGSVSNVPRSQDRSVR